MAFVIIHPNGRYLSLRGSTASAKRARRFITFSQADHFRANGDRIQEVA